MDGWNTTFLLGRPIFRGYVSFREVMYPKKTHSKFLSNRAFFVVPKSGSSSNLQFLGPFWQKKRSRFIMTNWDFDELDILEAQKPGPWPWPVNPSTFVIWDGLGSRMCRFESPT